ncbi:MAG: hypothetical protein E7277_00400 [Lachnospiraceae bacterium]|nr:hypothetical protein [Lachnospiraceae bacterium]
MRMYQTGAIGILATAMSLVACIEYNQNFNETYSWIFFGGQGVFGAILVSAIFFTVFRWSEKEGATKIRFILSIIVFCLMYMIAFTGSKYSFMLIVFVGVTETYLTRRRFGLIKGKHN